MKHLQGYVRLLSDFWSGGLEEDVDQFQKMIAQGMGANAGWDYVSHYPCHTLYKLLEVQHVNLWKCVIASNRPLGSLEKCL